MKIFINNTKYIFDQVEICWKLNKSNYTYFEWIFEKIKLISIKIASNDNY